MYSMLFTSAFRGIILSEPASLETSLTNVNSLPTYVGGLHGMLVKRSQASAVCGYSILVRVVAV